MKKNKDKDLFIYRTSFGKDVLTKGLNQIKIVKNIEEKDVVFVTGPAGTGKTYICIALALRFLKANKLKKIILTRPAIEAGENLGFLPGDLKEKLDPYLQPLYDALLSMLSQGVLEAYMKKNIIQIAPLAFMRGRTLNDAFVILDEAQNTTDLQMKMFLTRMGPNTKLTLTGDLMQIDLPSRQESGLLKAIKILKNVKGIGIVDLKESDIMRHKLVKQIIKAYKRER